MKCLVTGGAGFIGSHLVESLLVKNHIVRVVDNFITGRMENILSFRDQVEFIDGDIRDFSLCRKIMEGIDWVFHQAALPSVPRSVKDPLLTNEINITGTLNLLLSARDGGVKKFVFASSSSVYGDNTQLPKKEEVVGKPLSPYAVSKRVGEFYCQVFSELYELQTVSLRYFNIFGPRQDPASQYAAVIPNFISRMLQGKNPIIFGEGKQSRDFTFVENVVEANLLAAQANNVSGRIFNIACGKRTTILELTKKINYFLHLNIPPLFEAPRPGDVKHSFADISQAEFYLKYKPGITFDQGLEKTILWYKQRND
ncbi:MAG: SDR family oxidoreductase [Acidobacteriota bacterium]